MGLDLGLRAGVLFLNFSLKARILAIRLEYRPQIWNLGRFGQNLAKFERIWQNMAKFRQNLVKFGSRRPGLDEGEAGGEEEGEISSCVKTKVIGPFWAANPK